MKVANYIETRLNISNKALQYRLGKDVKLHIQEVSDGMVLFLIEQFELNPDVLVGDIRSLYKRKQQIDAKRIGEMTYKKHLKLKLLKNGLRRKSVN